MTNPSNIPAFVGGGRTGTAPAHSEAGITMLEYIKAHPATRPWYAQYSQLALGAGGANNVAIDLEPGTEGIIHYLSFLGDSGLHAGSTGLSTWTLLLDRVPFIRSRLMEASAAGDSGNGGLNTLPEQDGMGNSWATPDIWLPDDAVVEMVVIPGAAYAGGLIGWTMYGWYWPVAVREQWHAKGWDVLPRQPTRTVPRVRRRIT